MRRVAAAALLLAASLLVGCSSDSASLASGPTAAALPATGSSLGPAEFAAAAKLPDTVLLDVRTQEEYATGHLDGAVNLDVRSPDFAQDIATLDPAKNYAVYCRSGARSKTAMAQLSQAGFGEVYDLAGGIGAWQSAGGEVVVG